MGSQQRYISNELTHFVGRDEQDKNAQYQILSKILKDCHVKPKDYKPGKLNIWRNLKPNARISDNNLYLSEVVCFCDIPLQDLQIHTSKYSLFGLSFEKDFVIRQGGIPVYYIPKEAKYCLNMLFDVKGAANSDVNLEKAFNSMHEDFMQIRSRLSDKTKYFLYIYFFHHLKFFDHNLPDGDEQNYYFEREWRLHGELNFKIEDVKRVFIEECYAKKFRIDFPKYYGQISFLE